MSPAFSPGNNNTLALCSFAQGVSGKTQTGPIQSPSLASRAILLLIIHSLSLSLGVNRMDPWSSTFATLLFDRFLIIFLALINHCHHYCSMLDRTNFFFWLSFASWHLLQRMLKAPPFNSQA